MVCVSPGIALHTVTSLAKSHNLPWYRVAYHLKSRQVRPIGRAGHCNLYDDGAVAAVAELAARMEDRRAENR